MIQVAIEGSKEAAFYAAKRGFIVFGVEEELEESVKEANGIFVLFGNGNSKIRIKVENLIRAVEMAVKSADIAIIGGGKYAKIFKLVCEALKKPYVEGNGKEAVEKAAEKIIRYNLFGKK